MHPRNNFTNLTNSIAISITNLFLDIHEIRTECIGLTPYQYHGTMSQDQYGRECLPWSDNNVTAEFNYCRSIDGDVHGPFTGGVSAYMLDVNPFDQPGVETYKANMFKLLGKPNV